MRSLIGYINNKDNEYILDRRFDIKKDGNTVLIDFDNSMDQNFYSDKISSLNFIVGANGTGKTTKIVEHMSQLMKDNVAIKIYLTENNELEIYVKKNASLKVKSKLSNQIIDQEVEENIIFSSSSLEPFKRLDKKIHNISTSEYLLENSYNEMLNRDMIQQVEYCLNSDKKIQVVNWDNKIIKEVISYEGENIQKVTSFLLSKFKFKDLDFEEYSLQEKLDIKIFKRKRNTVLTAKFISMLISNIETEKWNSFKKTMDDKNEDFSLLVENLSALLPDTFDFKGLKTSFNALLRFEYRSGYKLKNKNDEDALKRLIKEINKNDLSIELSSVLRLEWKSISYGEYNLLNLFGRYYSLSKSGRIKVDQPIILFIDEIDIGIHPEWQINLMNILFNELPKIFKSNIQLFMTTHSPLLLSDILDRDIAFFEEYQKESKEKILTFGQNVQTLLTSAFFLKKTIGVFFQKKIKKISNIVSDPYITLKDKIYNDKNLKKKDLMDLEIDQITCNKILKLIKKLENESKENEIYKIKLQIGKIIIELMTVDYKKRIFTNRARQYYENNYLDFNTAHKFVYNEINNIGEEFYRKILTKELNNFKLENEKETWNPENKTDAELNEMLKKIEKELSRGGRES